MSALTVQINSMIEFLQEPEQALVFEIVKRFLPDDVATPEDLTDIAVAREEYRRGETTKDEDIDWDDDELLPDEAEAIKQARAEFARGEYTRHEDINWD